MAIAQRRRTFLIAAVSGVIVLAVAAAIYENFATSRASTQRRNANVRAAARDVVRTLRLTGKIKPQSTTEVKSPVSGRLVAFLLSEGANVHAGQPIAVIEPDQSQALLLGQIKTDVQLKSIALEDAARQWRRANELAASGLISAVDLERAKTAYESAKNVDALARDQRRILEQQMPQSVSAQRTFQLIAPVDGVLLAPPVSPGESIIAGTTGLGSGGTVVTKIADMSAFLVRVDISEVDVMKVKPGMRATVVPAALANEKLRGHLIRVGVEGTTAQNVTTYRGDIALDEPVALLPEMTADVDIIVEERHARVAIPLPALMRSKDGDAFVFKPGQTTRVRVTPGLVGDDLVEILSGVEPGETVEIIPPTGTGN